MSTNRHEHLVDEMISAIRGGRWPMGGRLPTVRAFAESSGVAVATAAKVYASLETLGLVSGETGRGTFVREASTIGAGRLDATMPAPELVDLAFNYPHTPAAGQLMQSGWDALGGADQLGELMIVPPLGGHIAHRRQFADHLHTHGLKADAENMLVVGGAQQGLACAVMALMQPGDVLAVDALTYPGLIALGVTQNLDLQPIRWQPGGGPDLEQLEKLLRRRTVRAIYAMPTIHNPTGWVMEKRERQQLVKLAERYGTWIIEDATYAFLQDQPPPPLAALLPQQTVYVSSLSKSVGGGIRVGFLVLPPLLKPRFERILRALTWSQPALFAALAAKWVADGDVARLEKQKRQAARERQKLVRRELGVFQLESNPSSFFVWLHLPEDVRPEPLAIRLAEQGIAVAPASAFAVGQISPRAIRLSLASASMEVLKNALPVVKQTIQDMELGV